MGDSVCIDHIRDRKTWLGYYYKETDNLHTLSSYFDGTNRTHHHRKVRPVFLKSRLERSGSGSTI